MNSMNMPSLKTIVLSLLIAGILAALASFPFYAPAYWIVRLTSIIMFIVLTVSWTLFSGPTGYISLATAAFFGIGIYTSAVLGKELPLLPVILIGGLISSCLALLVGAVTLRLRGIYFAIFTFGMVELIKQLILFWEVNITGTRGRFVALVDNNTIYWVVLGIFGMLLFSTYMINRSKFGLALRSIGEYEDAAVHMGINVTMLKIIIFGVSAFFMGAVGAIMATRWTYIDPYVAFNSLFSFLPVLMAIFGGMSQLFGPVIGAFIFAYLEEILLTKFQDYFMLTFGIILVITIIFLPGGLMGLVQNIYHKLGGGKRASA